MKQFLSGLYALALSAGVLYLAWLVQPMLMGGTWKACAIIFVASIVALMLRGILKYLVAPVFAICKGEFAGAAYTIFTLATLVGLAIPWLHGITGWNAWTWVSAFLYASLIYTVMSVFALTIRPLNNK